MQSKNPDESVSKINEVERETDAPVPQIPPPHLQNSQIPVTFAPADKQAQMNSQPQFIPPQNQGQIAPSPQYNAMMPGVPNQQFPQQQPGMMMQPQVPFYPQQGYQQQPFQGQNMNNQMMMANPNLQQAGFQQPIQQPNPQSFALPGKIDQNAQPPKPFNPAPPTYLPVMAPAVNHYPWQQGSHYVVGQPANYQYLYYPGAAPAKAIIGEQALKIPEGKQFEQAKIDLRSSKTGEGKKVANSGCHCQGNWGLLLGSGIIVIVGLILGILLHPALFALFALAYIVRSIIICCSETSKFLQLLDLDINPYEHTDQLQKTEPYTVWRIQCYHMERRTRYVTQRSGNRTRSVKQTYYVRVNTHSASKHITYPNCGDASPILSGLEDFRLTRIYYTFDIAFDNPDVQMKYNEDRRDWIRTHDRDTHYEFNTNDCLPGLRSHFLSFNDKKEKFPKCLNCRCFTVLSVFLVDWILIFWFMRYSARLDYSFLKVASNYDKH